MAWGAIAAGALGFLGGRQQNRTNQREAEKNRQFQERMRNTQWQAAVADMEKAGLNPALAYSQGPAASPGGSQAAPAANLGSSAMEGLRARKELEAMTASIEKTRNESRASGAIADREEARNRAYGFTRRPDGSISFDYSMPGLLKETEAMIAQRIAEASRSQHMAQITGVGSQVSQGFEQMMPGFQKIMGVAGQGADQLGGAVQMLERVARMRDDAVQAFFGLPKKALMKALEALQRRKN